MWSITNWLLEIVTSYLSQNMLFNNGINKLCHSTCWHELFIWCRKWHCSWTFTSLHVVIVISVLITCLDPRRLLYFIWLCVINPILSFLLVYTLFVVIATLYNIQYIYKHNICNSFTINRIIVDEMYTVQHRSHRIVYVYMHSSVFKLYKRMPW